MIVAFPDICKPVAYEQVVLDETAEGLHSSATQIFTLAQFSVLTSLTVVPQLLLEFSDFQLTLIC